MDIEDGRVVPNFLKQALLGDPLTVYGDGSQTRSFCYVTDLVEGIYRLLVSNEHEPVNVGNPVETTILKFAETINRITGNGAGVIHMDSQRTEGDPQRRRPDISRALDRLGWEPTISLDAGIEKTIPYFKTQLGLE
jgi:dTDP-glucose 4,6-dehydratase